MNIEQMKREHKQLVDKAGSLLKGAESRADKAMTSEENTEYESISNQIDNLSQRIQRAERQQTLEAASSFVVSEEPTERSQSETQFRSVGDFLNEVLFVRNSARISEAMKRTTTLGDQDAAGALVPPQFDTTLRRIDPNEVIVRPRATVIAAGDSPDATFNMISFDQSGTQGVYGGATSEWVSENADRTPTNDIKVKTTQFTPFINSSWIPVSNSLRNNFDGIATLVTGYLGDAINNSEEKAFLTGDGVGKPLGFIGHPNNATVVRGAAGTINYSDLIKMLSLTAGIGGFTWICSKAALPSLASITNPAGQLIWQQSAREGIGSTILGYPVLFSDRVPVLGSQGDITLANLKQYIIKDGHRITLFVDPYTLAHKGITRMFARYNVDGKPLLTTPIKGEDGVNRSAFVSLVNASA